MLVFVHTLLSRQQYNSMQASACGSCQRASHLFGGEDLWGWAESSSPTFSLNLPPQLAPTPLKFPSIISYPSFPRREAVPKWLITVMSALSQELVGDYTLLTDLDNCIKYLCWWTDTKYLSPNKKMLQAETLTVRPRFQRDFKPGCTSGPLPSPVARSHSCPSPALLLVSSRVFLQPHSPQGKRSNPAKDNLTTTKNKGKS